jgi:diaminopropionate ammonia-lyase
LNWFSHPAARSWRTDSTRSTARDFHASFPGYAPTPLLEVPALAAELGVRRLFVKDESSRLGLPAFKMLGTSWAIARLISAQTTTTGSTSAPTFEQLRALVPDGLLLVTATDGNHGRAVARMAALLGARAHVFVPAAVPTGAVEAIAAEGATITRTAGDYDDAVRDASVHAQERPEAWLVQDMSWEGYQQVPGWIVEGYETMLLETDEQLGGLGMTGPDLVVVPTGVGSLLQAVIRHYRSSAAANAPAILAVEPDAAACALRSLRHGRPTAVQTDATVMTGLNCGSISQAAWPFMRDGLDAAVSVSDGDALRAVSDLRLAGISSGPCGAASLAGARRALLGSAMNERRNELAVSEESVVVLLSTEGDNLSDTPGRA